MHAINVKNKAAARYALSVANNKTAGYLELSYELSWDAVLFCAYHARIIPHSKIRQADSRRLVRMDDQKILSRSAMLATEEGHMIGFFDEGRLVHVMVATGNGRAAGSKNDRIGINGAGGWEVVDLAKDLVWEQHGVRKIRSEAPTADGKGLLLIRSRPISELWSGTFPGSEQ